MSGVRILALLLLFGTLATSMVTCAAAGPALGFPTLLIGSMLAGIVYNAAGKK